MLPLVARVFCDAGAVSLPPLEVSASGLAAGFGAGCGVRRVSGPAAPVDAGVAADVVVATGGGAAADAGVADGAGAPVPAAPFGLSGGIEVLRVPAAPGLEGFAGPWAIVCAFCPCWTGDSRFDVLRDSLSALF